MYLKKNTLRIATGLAVLIWLGEASAAVLTLNVREETFTGGGTGVLSDTDSEISFAGGRGQGSASLSALRGEVEARNEGEGWRIVSRFDLADVLFSADVPGTSSATFGFGGDLFALLTGYSEVGNFISSESRINVDLFVEGNPLVSFERRASTSNGDYVVTVDEFVGGVFTVPVGIPIDVFAEMRVQAKTSPLALTDEQFARTDAFDSLTFNPSRFFDIQTAGVTANAGPFLVDNQLPGAGVPAPAPLALLALGLVGLASTRRIRSR